MTKSVLHSDRNLIISLLTPPNAPAKITIQSTKHGPDLSCADDVVIVADARALSVTVEDRLNVSAELEDAGAQAGAVQLMIRVGEYFGGWELELGDEEE